MAISKTDTEVIIGGKVFTLSGYESVEYLQKVASYINNKIAEYSRLDSYRRQSMETQNVLLELNIADDYFKAKKQIGILEEKNLRDMQSELNENGKKMVRLETELKEYKKERKG